MPIREHMPERRIEKRLLCSDVVNVEWKDKSGWMRTAPALLEDISASGACLQTECAVPAGASILIVLPRGVLHGEVRYCAYREIGFFVGLAFPQEERWSKLLYRPRHLVDPERFIARSAPKVKAAG